MPGCGYCSFLRTTLFIERPSSMMPSHVVFRNQSCSSYGRITSEFKAVAVESPMGIRRSGRNDYGLQGERQRRDDRHVIGASSRR